jgi:trimethylamine--corrinoid protein Co-methyltransferase
MDNEIIGMCERVLRGIEVNDETLAVELIKQVGPGGNFLTEPHTVMNMMNEFYNPSLADRTLYEEWVAAGRQSARDKARQVLDTLIADHHPDPLSENLSKEIRTRFPNIQD